VILPPLVFLAEMFTSSSMADFRRLLLKSSGSVWETMFQNFFLFFFVRVYSRCSGDSSTAISSTAISSTVSTHRHGYNWTFHRHPTHQQVLVGIISCLIRGKEGGTQVLAGLAPSSQTVPFIIEDPGANKGGSCRLSMKMFVDELTPSKLIDTGDELGCR
jgi:hypothetical protein